MSDFTRPAAPRSRRGSFDLRAPQNISLDLARSSTHLRSNSQLASAGSEAREMILQMPVGVSEDAQIRLSTGTKIHHQRCRESTSEIEKIFNEEKNKSLPPSPRLSQSSLFFDKSPAESLLNLNRNSSFARKFGGAEFHAHHAENWILDTDDKNYDFKFNVSVVGAKGTGKRTMVFKECGNTMAPDHILFEIKIQLLRKS
ncbi:hypothetical protein HK100_009743 [Physocladia obscura]|uniref:Uncharacterized protein n=1 Tax=Physocladia obscura TaxID=109957 RepID=A0AAD5T4T1_9FUNG|nr:hypothetical protein HK100_009743 [Physocladia obscura]